jgi:hypothetical protein
MIALGSLFALFGCAANQKDVALVQRGDAAHPLYVGRSMNGEVVVAASHADAMHGLAVTATDVAAKVDKADGLLLCQREMLTGTHVPTWICRYPNEVEQQRMATQQWMVSPKNCMNCRSQ